MEHVAILGEDSPLLIPGIGWVVECPHCQGVRQLESQMLWDWWQEAEDEAQYFIFHEPYELLSDYWSDITTQYDTKLKAQGNKTFSEVYGSRGLKDSGVQLITGT